jgi:hypothetical protein
VDQRRISIRAPPKNPSMQSRWNAMALWGFSPYRAVRILGFSVHSTARDQLGDSAESPRNSLFFVRTPVLPVTGPPTGISARPLQSDISERSATMLQSHSGDAAEHLV